MPSRRNFQVEFPPFKLDSDIRVQVGVHLRVPAGPSHSGWHAGTESRWRTVTRTPGDHHGLLRYLKICQWRWHPPAGWIRVRVTDSESRSPGPVTRTWQACRHPARLGYRLLLNVTDGMVRVARAGGPSSSISTRKVTFHIKASANRDWALFILLMKISIYLVYLCYF